MDFVNTILFAILTVFVAGQQLFYSRQRLKAKDAIISAKEAEIATLKSSNAELREFAKTYGPTEVKEIIKLKEDKAQEEARNAAKEIIRENIEKYTLEIEELKNEIESLKSDMEEGSSTSPSVTQPGNAEKFLSGKGASSRHSTRLYKRRRGKNIRLRPLLDENLFKIIEESDADLWLILNAKLMSSSNELESSLHKDTFNKIQDYLIEGAQDQVFTYEVRSPDNSRYVITFKNIKEHFWTSLAYYLVLKDENQDRER